MLFLLAEAISEIRGLYFKTKGVCMYKIVYNYKIGYTFSKYFLIFPWDHSFSISLL